MNIFIALGIYSQTQCYNSINAIFFFIYPSQKEAVGNRLAYRALAKDYHLQGVAFSGPALPPPSEQTIGN